jgi:hypothetical protein
MMATSGTTSLQTMLTTSPPIQQADPVDTASAEARARSQALAAQRMSEFLDGLPREFADPHAPPLTQKEINALIGDVEKSKLRHKADKMSAIIPR